MIVGSSRRSTAFGIVAAVLIATPLGSGFKAAAVQPAGDGGPFGDGAAIDARGDAPVDAPKLADAADAGSGSSDWWNTAWTHRIPLTVVGNKLGDGLSNFPVLVKIPGTTATVGAFDFTAANVNGDDLRFIDTDGSTQLAYDIDDLHASGPWWIWVKIPTLTKNVDHVFTMYYGNTAAAAASSGSATFSDDVSVHHLGATFADETGNGHTGSANGTTRGNGLIGGSTVFNGTSDVVTVPQSTAYNFTTKMSASMWVQSNTLTGYAPFVAKGDATWRVQGGNTAAGVGTTGCGQFGTNVDANTPDNVSGTITINDNNWHHVAAVLDGTTKHLYIDGVADGSDAVTTINTNSNNVLFGENEDPNPKRFFSGNLDDVRLTNAVRSAPWLAAEHDTVMVAGFLLQGSDQLVP